jgi:ribonuclease VapC
MIVIDTSALVAVALAEPERERFVQAILQTDTVLVSTVSVVEARMVVHARRGHAAVALLDDVLRLPMFEIVPPGAAEMDAAYAAFVIYGRGSGHAARLNFGDVFSYALAKVRGVPLLFKGNDFSETDVATAPDAGPSGRPFL